MLDAAAKLSLREDLANIDAVVSDARMRRMEKSASRMSEAQVGRYGSLWVIRDHTWSRDMNRTHPKCNTPSIT